MRKLNKIIVHCSANKEGAKVSVKDIRDYHVHIRGYRDIGYHFIVDLDGEIQYGRPIDQVGAHCYGENNDSVGVCYIGGLDTNGTPKDTRTIKQKESLRQLIKWLKDDYQISEVKGHRDYSPDKNKDGKITKDEWLKACPCFDAELEYKDV